jgi:hypothetical protein
MKIVGIHILTSSEGVIVIGRTTTIGDEGSAVERTASANAYGSLSKEDLEAAVLKELRFLTR